MAVFRAPNTVLGFMLSKILAICLWVKGPITFSITTGGSSSWMGLPSVLLRGYIQVKTARSALLRFSNVSDDFPLKSPPILIV